MRFSPPRQASTEVACALPPRPQASPPKRLGLVLGGLVAACLVSSCRVATPAPSAISGTKSAPADSTSSLPPATDPAATAGPPGSSPTSGRGGALYGQYCAVCHGPDGHTVASVKNAPNLNSQGLLASVDDDFLLATIAEGRPGANGIGKPGTKMLAFHERFRGPLSDADIGAIVTFVRRWQIEPSVALTEGTRMGVAATGDVLYQRDCAACHGADGWGEEAPRLAGSTLQATATDAFLRHTILTGRPGTRMLSFEFTEQEVADVIAFVRTWRSERGE